MFCKNCGATIPDNANVCPNCGAATRPAAQYVAPQTAQPATSLQSVLNVGNDVSKLLNYVTLICFALAGLLWIYAGASTSSSSSTETISNWFANKYLTFIPVMIGQGLFASAILTFFVVSSASFISKRTAYLASTITSILTIALTICSMYSFFETQSRYEMGDMNFAGWMVVILGLIGTVCSIFNYLQAKKQ